MTARTLVIGGTRNLGPDLVAALQRRGDAVTVLNRGQTAGVTLPRDVERLTADRSDAAAMKAALGSRAFDLVVDTTLYNGPDARAIAELLDGRAGRYVFWSTGQVYLVKAGNRVSAIGNREEDYEGPTMPEPSNEYDRGQWLYGMDKRAAEDALREANGRRGFPYVSLRMPMINSRRDHYGRLASYAKAIRAGETIVAPARQGLLKHVYGDDVIAATLRAADARVPAGTCLNIAQDEALTLDEMLGLVAAAVGTPLRLSKVEEPRERGPWSGTWMSVLDSSRSKQVLGIRYTSPAEYIPALL